eukprot:gene5304-6448_t
MCAIERCHTVPFTWIINPDHPIQDRFTVTSIAEEYVDTCLTKCKASEDQRGQLKAEASAIVQRWTERRMEVLRNLKRAVTQSGKKRTKGTETLISPGRYEEEIGPSVKERRYELIEILKGYGTLLMNNHPWMKILVVQHSDPFTRSQQILVQATSILLLLVVCLALYYSKACAKVALLTLGSETKKLAKVADGFVHYCVGRVLNRDPQKVFNEMQVKQRLTDSRQHDLAQGDETFEQVRFELDGLAVQVSYLLLMVVWGMITYTLLVYGVAIRSLMGSHGEKSILKAWIITLLFDNLGLQVIKSLTIKVWIKMLRKHIMLIGNGEERLAMWYEDYVSKTLPASYTSEMCEEKEG